MVPLTYSFKINMLSLWCFFFKFSSFLYDNSCMIAYLSVKCWHLHAGFDCCGSHFITPFWFLYFLCKAFLQFLSTDRPFLRCIVIFISEFPFLAVLNGHFCTFKSFLSSKLPQRRFHISDTTLPRVTLLTQTALNGYDGDLLLKASLTIFELQTHSSKVSLVTI